MRPGPRSGQAPKVQVLGALVWGASRGGNSVLELKLRAVIVASVVTVGVSAPAFAQLPVPTPKVPVPVPTVQVAVPGAARAGAGADGRGAADAGPDRSAVLWWRWRERTEWCGLDAQQQQWRRWR